MSENILRGQELAFDLARQFLSVGLAGIAFALAVTGENSEAYGTFVFWAALSCFGLSLVFGYVFLMKGTAFLSQDRSFDIFASGPRLLAVAQVLLVGTGSLLLLILHATTIERSTDTTVMIQYGTTGDQAKVVAPAGSTVLATIQPDGTIKAEIK